MLIPNILNSCSTYADTGSRVLIPRFLGNCSTSAGTSDLDDRSTAADTWIAIDHRPAVTGRGGLESHPYQAGSDAFPCGQGLRPSPREQ